MSRRIVVAVLASTLVLGSCGELAKVAGAGSHKVASVSVVLPPVILVGDTVQAVAMAKDGSGRVVAGDTAVWRTSDASAVTVDARGRVTGQLGRHATIFADVGPVTGSASVSVGDDQRLGYALADQPSAPGPYLPAAATSFNSAGGPIEVTRAAPGTYSVRFAALGRALGQRDNVQVTAYGAAAGTFCKLAGWQSPNSDLRADVLCFSAAGTPTDSRFTILLSGARPFAEGSHFGFALAPDFGGALTAASLDTLPTSRNSSSGIVNIGHNSTGNYSLQFPGLEKGPGQGVVTFQVTAVGAGTEHCQIGAEDPNHAGVEVLCANTSGQPADARFSLLFLTRARPNPLHFGYALADQPGSTAEYTPVLGFWRNNSGDTVTARLLTTGQYRVTFVGQANTTGAPQTVLVSTFGGVDHTCTTGSWSDSGTTNLAIYVNCFNSTGAPANSQFNVLFLQ